MERICGGAGGWRKRSLAAGEISFAGRGKLHQLVQLQPIVTEATPLDTKINIFLLYISLCCDRISKFFRGCKYSGKV